jgi:hypothetical protein
MRSRAHVRICAGGAGQPVSLPRPPSCDFVFDNQMLAQCVHFGFRIGEVSCPTKYFEEASSINFRRSVEYGFGVVGTTLQFALHRAGITHHSRFSEKGRRLELDRPQHYARPSGLFPPA